jgi:hypothetical protein
MGAAGIGFVSIMSLQSPLRAASVLPVRTPYRSALHMEPTIACALARLESGTAIDQD